MTDTKPVLAWHGSEELKADAVERMRAHAAADRLAQGDYLTFDDDGKWHGCFHGCLAAQKLSDDRGITIERINYLDWGGRTWWDETSRLFGIPIGLCKVLDGAFEACPDVEVAAQFAVDVTEAIPVGADLAPTFDAIFAEALDLTGADDGAVVYDHARIIALLKAAPVPARAEG